MRCSTPPLRLREDSGLEVESPGRFAADLGASVLPLSTVNQSRTVSPSPGCDAAWEAVSRRRHHSERPPRKPGVPGLGLDDVDPECAQLARMRAAKQEVSDHRMARLARASRPDLYSHDGWARPGMFEVALPVSV